MDWTNLINLPFNTPQYLDLKQNIVKSDPNVVNQVLTQHITKINNIQLDTIQYDNWLGILVDLLQLMYKFELDIAEHNLWVDCKTYYLFLAPQRSAAWHKVRIGRASGSVLARACGVGKYSGSYASLQLIAQQICGIIPKEFDQRSKEFMAHGTKVEPITKQWHEQQMGTTVLELPFAVPKWCPYIGVSVDGYIYGREGICEYKAPQKMYRDLDVRTQTITAGLQVNIMDCSNIIIDHLFQMYLGMIIFGKNFCDYVVYDCVTKHKVYLQRVIFDPNVWLNEIYPKLNHFIEQHLKPNMPEGYPLLP